MIKGNKKENYFIQKLCANSVGTSVPLMYPEGLLFPNIFYLALLDSLSIVGAMPAPLLTEKNDFGFASLMEHTRSRLTSASSSTSSNVNYASMEYDKACNAVANSEDTRIMIRRGVTVNQESGDLGLRGTRDSSLLDSFDSKQMVRNLCASQQYHTMTHFLTFTCNMKKHFGTKVIRNWIDGDEWKKKSLILMI